jgi:MYXO-CTERM domain-containing protein
MRVLAALVCLLGVVSLTSTAHAFESATTFDEDTTPIGGGGGRHFTGSINDGFTCAVCHRGGDPDPVEITGLPLDGYVPGGAYEIEILMPNAPRSSLGLELTDMNGNGVGSLSLPATPEAPELCTDTGEAATSRFTLPNDRTVISMDACGAQRVRAVWTAPEQPPGAIWFHTVVVTGDGNVDTEGDGVEEIARVIPIAGASAEAARVGSTCSAGGSPPAHLWWIALALLGLVRRRR